MVLGDTSATTCHPSHSLSGQNGTGVVPDKGEGSELEQPIRFQVLALSNNPLYFDNFE